MGLLRDITQGFSRSGSDHSDDAGEIQRPDASSLDSEAGLSDSTDSGTNAVRYANGSADGVPSQAPVSEHDALAQELPMIIPNATPEDIAAAVPAQGANTESAPAQEAPAQAAPSQPAQSHSFLRGRRPSSKKGASDKDLQRLRRVDLLELLVDQIRENEYLASENAQLTDLSERLKAKLDQKDAQIEHLKERLSMKDDQINRLEERNRAMAHASGMIDVSELVAIEEVAVDHYLKQLSEQGFRPATNPDSQQ